MTTDTIVFVPVGAWIASAFTRTDHRVRSLGVCALLGAALAAAVELAQVLVYSRFVDTTDILTGTVGATAGAWIMRRWIGGSPSIVPGEPGRFRRMGMAAAWLGVAILYAAGVTALFWSPFEFVWDVNMARQRWTEFFRTPFSALYFGSEFHAIQEVLRKLLFFAPLGAVLAQVAATVADRRLRHVLLAVLFVASVALAMGIELGQLFLPSHLPDFTDVLLCAAGAALGMTLGCRMLKGTNQSHNRATDQRLGAGARELNR